MGRLQVVPGTYTMADYNVFMIYLVNEQGYIVWSFQPMGNMIICMRSRALSARMWTGTAMEGHHRAGPLQLWKASRREAVIGTEFEIHYQRTGGFSADTEYKKLYLDWGKRHDGGAGAKGARLLGLVRVNRAGRGRSLPGNNCLGKGASLYRDDKNTDSG